MKCGILQLIVTIGIIIIYAIISCLLGRYENSVELQAHKHATS